jgi:hypothetical protein
MARIEKEDPKLYAASQATFGSGVDGSFSAAELRNHARKLRDGPWTRVNPARSATFKAPPSRAVIHSIVVDGASAPRRVSHIHLD